MNINKLVIAGAGTMGSSMAQIYAEYFDDVILYNHRQETLDKAKERIEINIKTLVDSREINEDKANKILSSLSYTTDKQCFTDADFISENLAENLDIKDEFYKEISKICNKDCIITTNTSGLSINRLSSNVSNPNRFLGMHWFNPPHLVPLIEIIKSENTSDEVAKTTYDLALKINKKPVIVNKDVLGFAANRIQLAILRESLDLVKKGVISKEGIDDVMKYGLGFRYACLGPLEVVDLGGIDIFYHVGEYLYPDLCDDKIVSDLLRQHFDNNELGVKTGKGFYDYSNGKDKEKIEERDKKFLSIYNALYK